MIGISLNVFSQEEALGQLPSKIKWQKLKTPAAIIIYPSGNDSSAQRVANIINYQQDSLTKSVGQKSYRTGIVLQSSGVLPNAYVALAPFRSVFYGTAPENIQLIGSTDWLDVLSIHENRHIQQTSNTRYGLSKFFYYLQGESGWSFASNIAIPNWYFEGDAVWAETSFTQAGRGRTPSFSSQQRALAFSNTQYDYQKSRNGSFKDFVPDHYRLGYSMLSHLRNEKGADVMVPVLKDASAYKGIIYPFDRALKKHTGYTSTSLYNATHNETSRLWKEELSNIKTTPTQAVTALDNKTITNYYFPQITADGELYAFKNSYKETDKIISINNNKETNIISPGLNFGNYFNVNGNNFIWTEYRKNPRRGYESFSEIFIFNKSTDKKQKLTKGGKFFSPIINHSGDKVIAIHFSPGLKTTLKEINTTTSQENILTTFELGESLTGLTFSSNEKELIYVLKRNSKLSIWKYNLADAKKTQLTPWTYHIIGAPRVKDNDVYFSSSYSGIDNIYKTSLVGTLEIEQLTSVEIGAYQPCINKEGTALYFVEHTVKGRVISKIEFASISNSRKMVTLYEPIDMKWLDKSKEKPEIVDFLKKVPTVQYESTAYSGLFRGMRLHSWGFTASRTEPALNLKFNNYLNDFSIGLNSIYNINEKTLRYNAEVSYGKWYPLLGLKVSQSNRRADYLNTTNEIKAQTFDELKITGNIGLPLSWISGNYTTTLKPEASYNYYDVKNLKFDDITSTQPKSSYSTIDSDFEFSILRRTASQNLASRLGISLNAKYVTNISQDNDSKLNASLKLYLPGLAKNHSFRINGGFQKELLSNAFQLTDNFAYTRGFETPINDEFIGFSAEYALPIAYPDWGLWGITYFKRIKANMFYDYGQGKFNNLNQTQDYQSAGLEVIFDNVFLNLLPISIGVRGTYLLTEDPQNPTRTFVPSFHFGVTL